jgi:HAE1 family hydrophobic/amphiphilic exporter-1
MTAFLFIYIPKGFLPSQDQNFLMAFTQAADRISFDDMVKHQEVANKIMQQEPDVLAFISVAGTGTYSEGIMFGITKKKSDRKRSVDEIVMDLRIKLNSIPGLGVFPQNPPPIQIGAGHSIAQYELSLQGSNLDELYKYTGIFESKMKALPGVVDVNTDVKLNSPKVIINVDRDKASALGLSLSQIQDAFFSAFASRKVSTIYGALNDYEVILEVQPEFKKDPNALSYLYIQSTSGKLVPLSTVAHIEETTGPTTVNHVGQLTSATIAFNLKPGYPIGNAVEGVKKITNSRVLLRSFKSPLRAWGFCCSLPSW